MGIVIEYRVDWDFLERPLIGAEVMLLCKPRKPAQIHSGFFPLLQSYRPVSDFPCRWMCKAPLILWYPFLFISRTNVSRPIPRQTFCNPCSLHTGRHIMSFKKGKEAVKKRKILTGRLLHPFYDHCHNLQHSSISVWYKSRRKEW